MMIIMMLLSSIYRYVKNKDDRTPFMIIEIKSVKNMITMMMMMIIIMMMIMMIM